MWTGLGLVHTPKNSLREFWQLWELHVAPHDSPRNTAWISLGIHATTRERSFFWHVLSPDSAQFKRGTGMLQMFSRFVTVGLGMFARFACYFQTCMEQLYLRFFVHVLYFNWTQINETNKQTAVDVKHWDEAQQLMWHLLHPDARRLGVHVVFFWFVAECKTQTDKRQLMSLKQTRDASTVDVEHRTVCVVFWFLRSSTERGNSLQRCHNTCSDARHQRCLKGKLQVTRQVTSQVLCLAGLFSSFWCVCVRVGNSFN